MAPPLNPSSHLYSNPIPEVSQWKGSEMCRSSPASLTIRIFAVIPCPCGGQVGSQRQSSKEGQSECRHLRPFHGDSALVERSAFKVFVFTMCHLEMLTRKSVCVHGSNFPLPLYPWTESHDTVCSFPPGDRSHDVHADLISCLFGASGRSREQAKEKVVLFLWNTLRWQCETRIRP